MQEVLILWFSKLCFSFVPCAFGDHASLMIIRVVGKKLLYLFIYPPWALIKILDFESGRLLDFHHFQQV